MSEKSRVTLFDQDDPEMQRANEKARDTFGYFWREVAWDRRRIIPALDLAAVKAPFSDDDDRPRRSKDTPSVEHMWISDVDFDGVNVRGVLMNSPNWVRSVREGDKVRVPLDEISDWMYVIGGEAYGGHTVNLLRSRMGGRERKEHDAAWGLTFGDPARVRLTPERYEGGEHPMSEAMAAALKKQLREDPDVVHEADKRGWTLLHHEALAGNARIVKILLAAGADPRAQTNKGMTPRKLARSLGWDRVVDLLTPK
jgi:uncharacterized protein